MSDASSVIFISSHSASPTDDHVGSTPYVVTSPPPDSPTDSKAAWPHQMMLEHVSTILGADIEEVQRQFPTNRSLLPIDVSPPRPVSPVFIPPAPSPPYIPGLPIGPYPGSELAGYVDPDFPSEPLLASPTSPLDPSTLQFCQSFPQIPLADITPICQVSHPLGDTTDYEELAMVLYRQASC